VGLNCVQLGKNIAHWHSRIFGFLVWTQLKQQSHSTLSSEGVGLNCVQLGEKYCALAFKNLWISRLDTNSKVILHSQVNAWD